MRPLLGALCLLSNQMALLKEWTYSPGQEYCPSVNPACIIVGSPCQHQLPLLRVIAKTDGPSRTTHV